LFWHLLSIAHGEVLMTEHNYRIKNARRLALASFALAGSLLLAACGGAGTTPGGAATATTAPNTSAATTEATTEAATEATSEATNEATAEATVEMTATTEASTAGTTANSQKLDLNAATEEQLLATIPNFGERMVDEFMEYRPYASIQQFRKEIGKYVDAAQVADYEKYVYVPVNANEADEATLQQIPGVDAAAAAALVAGRPYADSQAFLAKLAEVAPQSDATTAGVYLASQ
jgi:DNA uptake protein ComE-like DNA-binding protein